MCTLAEAGTFSSASPRRVRCLPFGICRAAPSDTLEGAAHEQVFAPLRKTIHLILIPCNAGGPLGFGERADHRVAQVWHPERLALVRRRKRALKWQTAVRIPRLEASQCPLSVHLRLFITSPLQECRTLFTVIHTLQQYTGAEFFLLCIFLKQQRNGACDRNVTGLPTQSRAVFDPRVGLTVGSLNTLGLMNEAGIGLGASGGVAADRVLVAEAQLVRHCDRVFKSKTLGTGREGIGGSLWGAGTRMHEGAFEGYGST